MKVSQDAASHVRDGGSRLVATPHSDPLPFLIADAEPVVLGRTVLAVAAMHEPDENGRCRICSTHRWWPLRLRSRDESWCSTRRMLWATLAQNRSLGAG
jgi:hypothetical protein